MNKHTTTQAVRLRRKLVRWILGLASGTIVLMLAAMFLFIWLSGRPDEQTARLRAFSDRDGDGLTDEQEVLYLTDPRKADTDGDGTYDGDEIAAGRNPLLAGDDAFRLPRSGSDENDSYTVQYLASLPENAARDEILNKGNLDAFIADKRGQLVPDIPDNRLAVIEPTDADTVRQYFETISSASNPGVIPVTAADIEAAWRLAYVQFQPETMAKLVVALEQNLQIYEQAPVPNELQEVHRRLIALNQALLDNARRLRDMREDFVGGLMASENIKDLGVQFLELAEDMAGIKNEYGIE